MLGGDQLGELIHVGGDEFAELEQHGGALGQGNIAPGVGGLAGRGDGGVQVRPVGQAQLGGDGAGGRVVDGLGAVALAGGFGAVDEVVDGGGVGRRWQSWDSSLSSLEGECGLAEQLALAVLVVGVGLEGLLGGVEVGDLRRRERPTRTRSSGRPAAGRIRRGSGSGPPRSGAALASRMACSSSAMTFSPGSIRITFTPRDSAFRARSTGRVSPSSKLCCSSFRARYWVPNRCEPSDLGEGADGGVAVVLDQDHNQLDAFGDGGDQFGVHHQVGAVPHHHHDVALLAPPRAASASAARLTPSPPGIS